MRVINHFLLEGAHQTNQFKFYQNVELVQRLIEIQNNPFFKSLKYSGFMTMTCFPGEVISSEVDLKDVYHTVLKATTEFMSDPAKRYTAVAVLCYLIKCEPLLLKDFLYRFFSENEEQFKQWF